MERDYSRERVSYSLPKWIIDRIASDADAAFRKTSNQVEMILTRHFDSIDADSGDEKADPVMESA